MKNVTLINHSSTLDNQYQVTNTKPKPPLKVELCLEALLKRGQVGLVALEALSIYGETTLHSTISKLANNHGILIERKREPHRHQRGAFTHFNRYTLIDDLAIKKAIALLEHYRKLRTVRTTKNG